VKFDIYGMELDVVRLEDAWRVYQLGPEGKKRLADGIVIPPELPEDDLLQYLADLLHEHASARHPNATRHIG
jgi:hypothetical protein